MSSVHQQINRARNLIWMNLWLDALCKLGAGAVVVFAVFAKIVEVKSWSISLLPVAVGVVVLVLVVSAIWSLLRRPDERTAAAALDEAAQLRERVSSSLYCDASDDPFAVAVREDAAQRAGSLTVRKHLKPHTPDSVLIAACSVVVAVLLWLVPGNWLRTTQAAQNHREEIQVTQARVAIEKKLTDVKKLAETNPALKDMQKELDKLDTMPKGKMDRPEDIRREALKKIDNLADAVKKRRQDEKYDKVTETKKMLRALREPEGDQSQVQKLTKQLAGGDFKSAQETLKELQEQLATLKQDSDKQFVNNMQKQLEQLAKQLDKISNQEQLKKQLEQAGIKKEDVERMLEQLSKEDLDQVKKQLEKSGMSQKQIEKLTQQMKKQQGAQQACQNMSQAMQSAAQSAGDV